MLLAHRQHASRSPRAIGFIALIGIEIKNSILLVDFTNQLRAAGRAARRGHRAGRRDPLPADPADLGHRDRRPAAARVQNIGLYSPMAWVIIGGLISSTLLARLVTPVMYKLIPPAIEVAPRERASGRKGSAA